MKGAGSIPLLRTFQDPRFRRWFARDMAWLAAIVAVVYSITGVLQFGYGWDAHAYWQADQGPMYSTPPGTLDAYNYSPLFAQALWPLSRLPFPMFATIMSVGSAGIFWWLLRPLKRDVAIPLIVACSVEYVAGNIFALLALAAAMSLRRPGWWGPVLITKVTSGFVAMLWYLVRGQVRALARSLFPTGFAFVVSALLAPGLWTEWLQFLVRNGPSAIQPASIGVSLVPGLVVRLPMAVLLIVWGARRGRSWTIPAAVCLATPVVGFAALTILTAVPRLRSESTDTSSSESGITP